MGLDSDIMQEVTRYDDGRGCTRRQLVDNILIAISQSRASVAAPRPIAMILFCPRCGTQHIDAPEDETTFRHRMEAFSLNAEWQDRVPSRWTPTNGVGQITTRGKEDNTWTNSAAVPAVPAASPTTSSLIPQLDTLGAAVVNLLNAFHGSGHGGVDTMVSARLRGCEKCAVLSSVLDRAFATIPATTSPTATSAEQVSRCAECDQVIEGSHYCFNCIQVLKEKLFMASQPATAPVSAADGEDQCAWTLDDSNDGDFWETGCGEAFRFTDGGPTDNGFIFCYKCGKRIDAGRYSDDAPDSANAASQV